jgi:hypothetical protein
VEVEPNFGAFVDEDAVRVATADGGIVEAEEGVEILTDEDDEDECDVCAELSDDLPCFEHFMQERGHSVGGDA